MGHVGIPEFLEQKWTRHAEGGARRTPNPVPQIAQKLSFGGSWDTVDRSGRRVPGSHLSWWRTDCVAEVPVLCERVSLSACLSAGTGIFLLNWGAEQVIRP